MRMSMFAGPEEAAGGAAQDEYEAVEGLDRASIECVRMHEAKAAEKTASDYQHIVWAYGVIWVLFCAYGILLWMRAGKIAQDASALARKINKG